MASSLSLFEFRKEDMIIPTQNRSANRATHWASVMHATNTAGLRVVRIVHTAATPVTVLLSKMLDAIGPAIGLQVSTTHWPGNECLTIPLYFVHRAGQ